MKKSCTCSLLHKELKGKIIEKWIRVLDIRYTRSGKNDSSEA